MDCLISLVIVVGGLLGIVFLSLAVNLFMECHKVSKMATVSKTPTIPKGGSTNLSYRSNVVSIDKWRKS